MLRTWPVRLPARVLTLSVRSFQTPETPLTCAWPPSLPSVPTSLGDARHLVGERRELVDHGVDGLLQLEHLAARVDRDLLAEVAVRDSRGDLGDVAHLRSEAGRHRVDVLGQVLPDARDALDLGLAAELALGADLAGHACDLVREGRELVDHLVDRRPDAGELPAHRAGLRFREPSSGTGRRPQPRR